MALWSKPEEETLPARFCKFDCTYSLINVFTLPAVLLFRSKKCVTMKPLKIVLAGVLLKLI
jgi:hypothetical protein